MELGGKVAVVTGGASGIGRAIVLELAAQGMDVAVADIEGDHAAAVADEAKQLGVRAVAVRTDVSDFGSVSALAETTWRQLGGAHLVCNNAGVLVMTSFADTVVEDWTWVYGVNVMGVVHGVHAFVPRLLEQAEPAHVVNTASIAAIGGHGVYGSTKVAVLAITEWLAGELAETPIAVSALLPGVVSTRILTAERNRPTRLGRVSAPDAVDSTFGVDPVHVARRLREGVQAGELHIFAGIPETFEAPLRDGIRQRSAALDAALGAGVVRG